MAIIEGAPQQGPIREQERPRRTISRRNLLIGGGVGAVGLAAAGTLAALNKFGIQGEANAKTDNSLSPETITPSSNLNPSSQEISPTQPKPDAAKVPEIIRDPNSLRELAKKAGISVGSLVTIKPINQQAINGYNFDPRHIEILENQFNIAAVSGLATIIKPAGQPYNFTPIDFLVDKLEADDMQVRGGYLLYGANVPDWLKNGNFSRQELVGIMQNHIRTVMRHYKDRIHEWGVVNEPNVTSGLTAPDFWAEKIGPDYISLAFETAREADEKAVLFLNDYSNETENSKRFKQSLNLVRDLKNKGLIDGIGLQMHIGKDFGNIPSGQEMLSAMQKYATEGVKIYVTEADVNIAGMGSTDISKQDSIYSTIADSLVRSGAGASFTMWGFSDADSWLTNRNNGQPSLLYDKNYNPKPSYFALQDTLRKLGS